MTTEQRENTAGRKQRRGRPGHDLETVLESAVALFNERGYDGTSMDDIAKRLGVTKSAIYHHVAGKDELLRLATSRALDELFLVAQRVRDSGGPAVGQLESLVRGSVDVLVAQLPFVTLLLRVRGNTEIERVALAKRRQFDRIVAKLVKAAEKDGDIRPDIDPSITSRLLFGMVNSLTEWCRVGKRDNGADIADAIVKIAFDGIIVRQPNRPDSSPLSTRDTTFDLPR